MLHTLIRSPRRLVLVLLLLVLALPTGGGAAGPSNTLETKVLEWLVKQTAFGTAPAALYVGLNSTDPGDTCANELAASGSYARAQLNPDTNNATNTNWNAVDEPATAKRVSNKLAITFPTATADWNSAAAIKWFTIYDASTSGTCLWSGAVNGTTGVVVLSGTTLSFTAGSPGQLAVTID